MRDDGGGAAQVKGHGVHGTRYRVWGTRYVPSTSYRVPCTRYAVPFHPDPYIPPPVPPSHVYIHVPFCARRCAYCDFAIAVRREVPVDEYLQALGRELELRHASPVEPWRASTLYLGGGTPSRLGGAGVARMMELLRRHVELEPGAEVTLEANPEDVSPESAAEWVRAGINRVSLGAQSLHPHVLEWMHRVHDVAAVPRAVEAVRAAGITNLSVDLIFALPDAMQRDWARDLDGALALQPTHVSLYGLTVEPRTPLGRWTERGSSIEAPEEKYADEFLEAHARCTAAGFEHYEVSNFGRPGMRARHNSAYWSGVAYAGLGPGAHEYDGVVRRWNVSGYAEWTRRLASGADPMEGSERLTGENRVAEEVYLGLRTTDGLVIRPDEHALVTPWLDAGWGHLYGDRLVLTPDGWLRLDSLAGALTVNRSDD